MFTMTGMGFDGLPDSAGPEELRQRLRALESLITRAPVPIAIAHDPEIRHVTANPALATLLRLSIDDNISLTPPSGENPPPYRIQRNGVDVPDHELPMQFAIKRRVALRNEIEIVLRDGTVLFVQNDVEPLFDAHGNVTGCVSVVVDLTARKRAEDALREADRRKDEFLATLSHELRNPLAPIRSALEVMKRAADDPRAMEQARAIMERQLLQLVRITDDLLDVSRITRDKLQLRREHVDLRTAVQGAIEATRPLIESERHALTVTLPGHPVWVNADLARLTQAFANLLNNAAKYTEPGGRISIAADAKNGEVAVNVSDSGIGIHPATLPHVFDMFMQFDGSRDRAQGGLGLGLTLVKRLVELHGGSVEAISAGAGQGSAFVIRLPLAAAAAPAQTPKAERVAPSTARILVAEDSADTAEMLRLMLSLMGHDVRVAADGVAAVAIAQEFQPQIAFLDIGMPRMDGYEAARRVRALLGPRVTLVALTGWGQEEDRRRAEEAGFDHHFTKPADPDALEALIASCGVPRSG